MGTTEVGKKENCPSTAYGVLRSTSGLTQNIWKNFGEGCLLIVPHQWDNKQTKYQILGKKYCNSTSIDEKDEKKNLLCEKALYCMVL